jgi:hypothetical protein
MLNRWQFFTLMTLAVAAVALAIANMWLVTRTRDTQLELGQRQQFIQQSVPLETLYRDIVKALAELGVKSGDRQVLDVLAAQGINLSYQGAAPAPAADASAKSANRK